MVRHVECGYVLGTYDYQYRDSAAPRAEGVDELTDALQNASLDGDQTQHGAYGGAYTYSTMPDHSGVSGVPASKFRRDRSPPYSMTQSYSTPYSQKGKGVDTNHGPKPNKKDQHGDRDVRQPAPKKLHRSRLDAGHGAEGFPDEVRDPFYRSPPRHGDYNDGPEDVSSTARAKYEAAIQYPELEGNVSEQSPSPGFSYTTSPHQPNEGEGYRGSGE